MNNSVQRLYLQFDSCINWNIFLYVVQKFISIILTIFLFKTLSAKSFSLWANINSIIFLLLLWLDFGFRKSVPKYIPQFSKEKKSHILFTKFIIKFQLVAGLICFCLSFFLIKFFNFYNFQISNAILGLATLVFFTEMFVAIIKLLFHAHLWNKEFNLMQSILTLFESIIICFFIFSNYIEYDLLNLIFICKIIFGIVLILLSYNKLKKLYKTNQYHNSLIDYNLTKKEFLQHSTIMWGNSILKSLTERNFLLPILTISMGIDLANIFKIANDWALLFQRFIMKAIGTNDISLLAHLKNIENEKYLMQDALKKIRATIFALCTPLFWFPGNNFYF